MAGWIVYHIVQSKKLGDIKLEDFDEAAAFAAIYRIGDTDFTSPDHHGTKRERLDAFLAGFEGKWPTIETAFKRSLDYVLKIEKKDDGDELNRLRQ